MYHYVRDLSCTPYPDIKGLLPDNFKGQLEYLCRHYSMCSLNDVRRAMAGESELSENACLLTFDDGLADHYRVVFPILKEHGVPAAFFPSSRPVDEAKVLDVHKIHFVLASTKSHEHLVKELLARLRDYRKCSKILPDGELWNRYGASTRFDGAETVFVKRMLQDVLPQDVRSAIVNELFAKYVTKDEPGFSGELYMNLGEIKEMYAAGMEIGGHGHNHIWLGKASRQEQANEIKQTYLFLERVMAAPPSGWTLCYPYGSYNQDTIALASDFGCAFGLTTKVELASLTRPMEMGRLDTNDLPLVESAVISKWTKQVHANR